MDPVTYECIQLRSPYTMIVAGQTGSGKTYFVKRLIETQQKIHAKPFSRIIYAYSMDQPIYRTLQAVVPELEFVEGIPTDLSLNGDPTLLVIDDMMLELQNDKRLAVFFTKMRHENMSTIFITQNIYFNSKYATTVSRNAQYLVLFPNLRDASTISTLGRQIFPQHSGFLKAAFDDATSERYGYIFLDLKTDSDPKLRVRTNIFPDEIPFIYSPKS